jgi:ribonucleoside-diphosphate reductase alpha chain
MSSARSRLPDLRMHEVFEFDHLGHHYTAGIGRYGHGRIGEVFLNASKSGTAIETHARDGAVILSLLLQHGCPINAIRETITRNPDGSAAGPFGTLLDLLANKYREPIGRLIENTEDLAHE